MTADRGVVLVTGAAGGIGRAIVETSAQRGWSVLATDRVPDATFAAGGQARIRYVAADVTSEEQMAAVVADARALGPLVGAIANAGVLAEGFSPLVDAAPAGWRQTLEVNVVGVLVTLQAAARELVRTGGGRLLATASVAGLRAEPQLPAYCASKAAVISIVRSLALELGAAGITVNAVAPGPVGTEAQQRVIEERGRPRLEDETAAQRFERHRAEGRPLARMATPNDVAEAFAWLLSDAAAYVTGEVLTVDGGSVLA
ncbi:SDR family NAD(P)-dependent oxidoreductase [Patulibacter defluvii]|uniref:SDR family NAD(P)-dependent oxidoreductase n=1 Tax=Patulibacter defluvii TaxID=3095358 RepID=UPI002A75CDF8|nr:SDR family oxidoreductase [Patulibacter sp. DM4]